ncbi:putative aminopeptidase II [Clostridiales bacterium KA00134]|nr:putative aminopeptidase II [Clostridiales bacterium KA00134]
MNLKDRIRKYANLIVNTGLGINPKDVLVIRAPVENYEFVRVLAEEAYKAGAKDVKTNFRDIKLNALRFENVAEEVLTDIPQYFIDEQNHFVDNNYKLIALIGEDPNGLKGLDPQKLMAAGKAQSQALKHFAAEQMRNKVSWCVVGAPTKAWARMIFEGIDDELAVEKLWELILDVSRVDEDPVKNWEAHIKLMGENADFLNENKFTKLKIKSSNGTDLEVGLPESYVFQACGEDNLRGERFVANIPTEEVFSMPHRDRVNGLVYASKPLNYNGNVIEDFWFKFKDGKVVDFDAKKGREILENMLNMDEGARHLGEVALVPYDSPISNTNRLFFETLYDENASCHLALGKAYPTCIENGDQMSEDELKKRGVNDSIIHVDFMFGYKDTEIVGVRQDGREVLIFENGNWAKK